MSSIIDIWQQLGTVAVVHFKAESLSGIGWDGSAIGVVKVSQPESNVLVFEESGQFRKPDGKEMNFRNTFRWTRIEDNIRLEHLRFGVDRPVFLFDMACQADGTWRETNPHPCRDDCYSATLRLEEEMIFVRWSVNGPKRNETIDYTYM